LAGITAGKGARIRIAFRDAGHHTWIGATEYDSYADGQRALGGVSVGGDLAFRVIYRRRLMDVFLAGARVLADSASLVVAAAATVGAAGLVASALARRHTGPDSAATVASAIGGGLLLTACLGLAAVSLRGAVSALLVATVTIALSAVGFVLWIRPRRTFPRLDSHWVVLVLGVAFFGLMHLRFATDLPLPPHVDGAIHTSIVQDLLTPSPVPPSGKPITDLFARYYHLGFHAMAAWILALSGEAAPRALAILGQLLLTAAIVSVYLLVYLVTRVPKAALAAFVLAGIGWTMPTYAGNWAKYPTLLSLAVFGFAGGLGVRALQGRRSLLSGTGAALLAIAAALMHTRALFLVVGLLLSFTLARRLHGVTPSVGTSKRTLLAAVAGGAALAAILYFGFPGSLDTVTRSLGTLVEEYGWISSGLVLALTPFAFRRYPTSALTFVLFGASILTFQLLPPGGAYPLPLIDEPLAKIALFLPMSALGGLGIAGLHDVVSSAAGGRLVRAGFAAGLAAVYCGYVLVERDTSPAECCLLARQDDIAVLAEAGRLEPESLIIISTQSGEQTGPSAVDGGAWLLPLVNRQPIAWRWDANLRSREEQQRLCELRVSHVYIGGMPLSYSRTELDLEPAFYTPVVVRPGAALYEVTGCSSRLSGGAGGGRASAVEGPVAGGW
jgi:hypothetical protein